MASEPPLPARVVIFDTDQASGRALLAALARGLDVTAATSLAQARHAIAATPVDILICPLSRDGRKLLAEAQERWPSAEGVFVYDAQQQADLASAVRGGAMFCLPRPVDPQVVRALVRRSLDARDEKQQIARLSERTQRELAEARRLQRAMLPPPTARLSGVTIAARCRPCVELGGDLVDYDDAGPTSVALLIADVAGHGVSAAMLTTLVKVAFRGAAARGYRPADVANAVAAALGPFESWRFVTLIAARIDRQSRKVEYVNAGHPPGWICRRGQITAKLDPTGPLICRGIEGSWNSATLELPEHADVLFYTDGITDATNAAGDRFGLPRLTDALARGRGGGESLLDAIFSAVDAFTAQQPANDDMTAMTMTVGMPGLA